MLAKPTLSDPCACARVSANELNSARIRQVYLMQRGMMRAMFAAMLALCLGASVIAASSPPYIMSVTASGDFSETNKMVRDVGSLALS